MESGLQLRADWIGEFADSCLSEIASASSKIEALELVASLVSPSIDEYRRAVLADPDEISLNFVDLLDQVVFELAENDGSDASVREYIIDDLYARLRVYIDVFIGRETYSAGLKKRYITREDTIVIRQCGMDEFIPLLMIEYNEQPALQRPILRALLSFERDELLNFYYDIAKESDASEIRALSLVGLKKFGTKFRHWRQLASDDEGYLQMIACAESFDTASVEANGLPRDLPAFMFVLHYIESHIDAMPAPASLAWVLEALHSLLRIGYYNSSLPAIYSSVCHILVFARADALRQVLLDDNRVKQLLELVDFLPREMFERIVPKLALMGDSFIHRVHGMVGAGKVKFDERESNTLSYILWKTGSAL